MSRACGATRPGLASSYDPGEPGVSKRVQRGGSFLCSDQYCTRYLPARGAKVPPIARPLTWGSGACGRRLRRTEWFWPNGSSLIRSTGPAVMGQVTGEYRSSPGGVRRAVPTWLSFVYNWLFSEFLTHLGFLLALVLMAGLLRQRRSPSSTIAWLLVILLLPYIGVPLYIMFGGRKMKRMARRKAADLPPCGGCQWRRSVRDREPAARFVWRAAGQPPATGSSW